MTYLKRYNANKDLTPEDRDAVRDLVRSLGHADEDIAAVFAITRDGIGTQIHLTEYLRDETGFKFLDVAADHTASRPHVHDITAAMLPAAIRPVVEEATR